MSGQCVANGGMRERLTALRGVFASVWRTVPAWSLLTFALMLVSGLLEGIGIVMLIPVLEILGVDPDASMDGRNSGASASLASKIGRVFEALSISPSVENVLLIFLAVLLARLLINFARSYSAARLTAQYHHATRMRVYAAISAADWPYLVRHNSSALSHAVTKQADNVSNSAYFILVLVASLISLLVGLFVAFLLSAKITLLVILIGISLAWPMIYFDRRAYRIAHQTWKHTAELFARMSKHFLGLKTAKILGAEAQLEAEFENISERQAELDFQSTINSSQAGLFYEFGSAIFLVVFVYLVVTVFKTSGVEPILLIIVFARIVPRAQNVQSYFRTLLGILPDFEATEALIEEAKRAQEPRLSKREPINLDRGILFENVEFSYDANSKQKSLDGISLMIPARSAVALVGPSGAGKTTFADLACGLIVPTGGRILIDDIELNRDTRLCWRASTAYVLQDEYLANTSILENMRLGNPCASEEDIWLALHLAKAADLVGDLPYGLNEVVGEHGLRLSRGERQRLCLARALLRTPSLLILDEATSALNPVDEAKLIEALRDIAATTTILVIAHRLSSIMWVDDVVILEHGRIRERGQPTTLMNKKGSFLRKMQEGTASSIP